MRNTFVNCQRWTGSTKVANFENAKNELWESESRLSRFRCLWQVHVGDVDGVRVLIISLCDHGIKSCLNLEQKVLIGTLGSEFYSGCKTLFGKKLEVQIELLSGFEVANICKPMRILIRSIKLKEIPWAQVLLWENKIIQLTSWGNNTSITFIFRRRFRVPVASWLAGALLALPRGWRELPVWPGCAMGMPNGVGWTSIARGW